MLNSLGLIFSRFFGRFAAFCFRMAMLLFANFIVMGIVDIGGSNAGLRPERVTGLMALVLLGFLMFAVRLTWRYIKS